MTEPINSDGTEKLQELLETIASGITKTEEILARSQQVEAEVSQHREVILAAVQEIGGQEAINALHQKLAEANVLVAPGSVQAEERLQNLETQFKTWAETVEGSVAQLHENTKLVSKLTLHTERKAYEVVEVQADIEQIANTFGTTVGELGGLDGLEALQKEHKSLLSTLEEIKSASQQFQQLQAEARHIDEKLVLVQEQFGSLSSLVTNAQSELVQKAVSLSGGDSGELQQIISQSTQELRQELQVIDNEHRQKIRTLERKQQSLISLILGGVGVAVVLLIVILVIVATKR